MAAVATPQMLRSTGSALRLYKPDGVATSPYNADADRLDAIATEMEGGSPGDTWPAFTKPANMRLDLRRWIEPRPRGVGVALGVATGDVRFPAGNKESGDVIDEIYVLGLWFRAAAGQSGAFKLGPGAGAQVTAISPNPGDFRNHLRDRHAIQHGANTSLRWTTVPGTTGAVLIEPNRDFCVYMVRCDYGHLVATGQFRPKRTAAGVSLSGCPRGVPHCNAEFMIAGTYTP